MIGLMSSKKAALTWITLILLCLALFSPLTPVLAATTEFSFSNSAPVQIMAGQKYKFDLNGLAPRDFSWIDPVEDPKKVTLTVADGPEAGQNVVGNSAIFVTQIGNMIVFKPEYKLKFSTRYELKIPAGLVKDNKTGEENTLWSKTFLTTENGDSVLNPPSLNPYPETGNVPYNIILSVEFGEIIFASTTNLEKITLTDPLDKEIKLSVTSNNQHTGLVITPLTPVQKNTKYTLNIPPNTIEDSEQNTNSAAIINTFTTGINTYTREEKPPGTAPAPYPDPILLTALDVAPANFTLNQGEALQLKATGKYNDNTVYDVTRGSTWTSADSSIAKVNANGIVFGLNSGKTQIKGTLNGLESSALITVIEDDIQFPDVDSEPQIVKPGEEASLDFFAGDIRLEIPAGTFATENEVIIKGVNLNSELAQPIIAAAQGFAGNINAYYLIQAKDTKTNQRVASFDQAITVSIKLNPQLANQGVYIYDPYYRTMVPLRGTYHKDTGMVSFRLKYAYPLVVLEERPAIFKDLPGVHWAKSYIDLLSKKNIINGVTKERFAPDTFLTRGQLAKVIALAAGIPGESGIGFRDVQPDYWASPFICSIKNARVITGYPDGSFKPESFVTRAEMLKMVMSAMQIRRESNGKSKFKDNGNWADDYIGTAVTKGIINGYSNGTFRPDKYITRAEAAKVIAKAYGVKLE